MIWEVKSKLQFQLTNDYTQGVNKSVYAIIRWLSNYNYPRLQTIRLSMLSSGQRRISFLG